MINDALYETILKVAAGKGTKVLFIGDEGQLKPVKQRTKARPFIRTNNISKLTQVMRTADGNPMPSEVLQPIRDNPNSRADMFDHTTTLSPKNEGIIFTNDSNKWLDDMLDKFTLEQLNKNPNYARALAYTNARVEELNTAIRTKMFGFGADTFYPGEIMMMYENLKSLPSGDYMYSNGADVIIDTINFTTDKKIVSPLGGEFTVVGYNISFLDATTNTPKGENLFIADMNTVNKEYLKELGILKTRAISAPANRRGEYWTDYYTFSSKYNLTDNIYEIQGVVYTNENVAFKALVNIAPSSKKKDLGKFKVKDKSINYAYAHTIHKSQGGTYDYAFVDENNIDIASKFENPDYEMINQLKYVGFSRSSKVTEVLSSKTGKTKGIATTAEEVPLPPDELQNLNNLFDEDNLPLTARKMEEFKLICKK
jgi:hypothetical protein